MIPPTELFKFRWPKYPHRISELVSHLNNFDNSEIPKYLIHRHAPQNRDFNVLRARRNEKEFKVKPATSFKYFQYLLTENLKQSSRQKKYYLTVP